MKKVLFVAIAAVGLTGCFDYSEGDRIGTVVKLSQRGFFCKTWEGQMYLGGMRKQTDTHVDGNGRAYSTSSMVANTFDFTVENPALVTVLLTALETAEPVRVKYRQELVTFCRSDSDNYFVEQVVTSTATPASSAPPVPQN